MSVFLKLNVLYKYIWMFGCLYSLLLVKLKCEATCSSSLHCDILAHLQAENKNDVAQDDLDHVTLK